MNPENIVNQLIVKDNFITKSLCQEIVETYNHSRIVLKKETDNKLDIDKLQYINEHTFLACKSILCRVRDLVTKICEFNIYLDYAALFARMEGNKCELHCDNLLLDCPTHGRNQEYLREIICNCSEATYKPNHTGWRNYTGLLYLDSKHQGGDIIFQDGPIAKIYTKKIEAIAGRLILTPNNWFYYHETTTITRGVRYSMNMWFTTDKSKKSHLL